MQNTTVNTTKIGTSTQL